MPSTRSLFCIFNRRDLCYMFSYDLAMFCTLDSLLACQYTYNKANN